MREEKMQHLKGLWVVLALFQLSQGSANAAKKLARLDLWAREQGATLFRDCANRSPTEVLAKLRRVQAEFSKKADSADLRALQKNPEFLQMGEVLFPALLPEVLPNRGAFLICDDSLQAVLRATEEKNLKEEVEDLDLCFSDAYRLEKPRWAQLLVSCFRDLNRK